MFSHSAYFVLPITVLSIVGWSDTFAVGIVVAHNYACESVADHELLSEELSSGNSDYEPDPSRCFVLRAGTRVSEAIESENDGKYVLVEVADRGHLWTPGNAVEAVNGDDLTLGASPYSVARSTVWFAEAIRHKFDGSLPYHGLDFRLDELAALPSDITEFDVGVAVSGGVLAVRGTLVLGPIPQPFAVHDGTQGKKYNLFLQAYLFSPDGRLIWEQSGHPQGESWVSADGAYKSFNLINVHSGDGHGNELMLVAVGDPLSSEMGLTQTVLGAESLLIPSDAPATLDGNDNLALQRPSAEDPSAPRVASCLDEDRVARSFCQAASEQTDPFLRAALWDQYNEYNRISSLVERPRR